MENNTQKMKESVNKLNHNLMRGILTLEDNFLARNIASL